MAKMMWKSADKIFGAVFLLTLLTALCLTAAAAEDPKPTSANSGEKKKDGDAAGAAKAGGDAADKTEAGKGEEEANKSGNKEAAGKGAGQETNSIGDTDKKTKTDNTDVQGGDKGLKPPKNVPLTDITTSGGSFMTYFIASVVILVLLYIGFHNRHKILAYIVEGRRGARSTGRRRGTASGSSGGTAVEYRQLNNAAADELLQAAGGARSGDSEEGKPDYMY